VDELIRLAAHAKIGGMFSGKSGIVNVHMGDRQDPFDPLYKVFEKSDLTHAQFLPTHCNRNDHIFEESKKYGMKGFVDFTAYPKDYDHKGKKASEAVARLFKEGLPPGHITVSSDGCGSLPFFKNGKLIKLGIGEPDAIFYTLLELVDNEGLTWEEALPVVTSNPANIFMLPNKGIIQEGNDADLVLLNSMNEIEYLVANGEIMIRQGKIIRKGTFEE
jgi:beta-aspartyl-dipeptidase (metallo-type)